MVINQQTAQLICDKFEGYKTFLGNKFKQKTGKEIITQFSSKLRLVENENEAQLLIENNVGDFYSPLIITDYIHNAPSTYELTSLNKTNNVNMYVDRMQKNIMKNPYIEKNLYRLNENKKLFTLVTSKIQNKTPKDISELFGKYQENRLIIVGGGESWKEVKWNELAKDIKVMIVNYNFELKSDFLIFNDKHVGRDLETVKFHDNRLIIGNKDRFCSTKDYEFTNDLNFRHTGAMAVYLAWKMGFKLIYLAGFDYYQNKEGKDHLYLKDDNNKYNEKRIKLFLADYEKFEYDNLLNFNENSKLKKCYFVDPCVVYKNDKV